MVRVMMVMVVVTVLVRVMVMVVMVMAVMTKTRARRMNEDSSFAADVIEASLIFNQRNFAKNMVVLRNLQFHHASQLLCGNIVDTKIFLTTRKQPSSLHMPIIKLMRFSLSPSTIYP